MMNQSEISAIFDGLSLKELKWKGYRILISNEELLYIQKDDGNYESISHEDLIKYIGERNLIQENELVREMYDRYQVTIKLVRSDENDHTGV